MSRYMHTHVLLGEHECMYMYVHVWYFVKSKLHVVHTYVSHEPSQGHPEGRVMNQLTSLCDYVYVSQCV